MTKKCTECGWEADEGGGPEDSHEDWCPQLTGYSRARYDLIHKCSADPMWAVAEIERLSEAFDRYGKHDEHCRAIDHHKLAIFDDQCNCGLKLAKEGRDWGEDEGLAASDDDALRIKLAEAEKLLGEIRSTCHAELPMEIWKKLCVMSLPSKTKTEGKQSKE